MLHTIPFHASLLNKELRNNKKTTNSHVLIYGAVEIHAIGDKGCIASNEHIAKETGLSKQTVANCISEISSIGWIKVNIKSGMRTSIEPLLTINTLTSQSNPPYSTEYTPLLPKVTPLTSGSNIDNILDNSIDNTNTYTREFDEFWKIYPKKNGKKNAFSQWKKLIKQDRQKAVDDIPKRKLDDKWLGGYIKDPERYLKDRQFEDEIRTTKKQINNNAIQAPKGKYDRY